MENNQTTRAERRTYGIYFFGQNVLWTFAGYVSTYLLDIGIDATVASAILLLPKIWDAVNDTLFGYIVDRFSFKNKQKFMPWIRIGTAVIGASVILMFAIPASLQNPSLKIAWFIAAYIIFDAAYTVLDAPMYAMPTAMTTSIQERTALISSNRFWGNVGAILATVIVPFVRPKTGWLLGSIIFTAVSLVFMLPFIFFGKERNTAAEDGEKKDYTFKEMLAYVKTNKYLLLSLLFIFVIGCCSVEQTLSLIMARNCLGDESMATIVTACVAFPVVLVSLVTPRLTKKFDKYDILVWGLVGATVFSVATYLIGYTHLVPILVLVVFKFIGYSFFTVLNYMFIADSVEYGTYKSGTRATGITFSLQTFESKLRSAVINSIALFSLGLFGYDSTLAESAVQSDKVINGIWTVFNLLPAAGYVIAIILLVTMYKLRDKDVEVMAKYNNGEISYDEACEKLEDKFGAPAVKQ